MLLYKAMCQNFLHGMLVAFLRKKKCHVVKLFSAPVLEQSTTSMVLKHEIDHVDFLISLSYCCHYRIAMQKPSACSKLGET